MKRNSGEILALTFDDISVTSRQICVRNKPDHRVKGGRERLVPLNDIVAEILTRRPHTGDWVFQRDDGTPYRVKYLSDRFRYFRRKAGLPEGMRFHSMRHTSLTWMHHAGVPAESLRQIAGHSSIVTTQIYTHALPQHL